MAEAWIAERRDLRPSRSPFSEARLLGNDGPGSGGRYEYERALQGNRILFTLRLRRFTLAHLYLFGYNVSMTRHYEHESLHRAFNDQYRRLYPEYHKLRYMISSEEENFSAN